MPRGWSREDEGMVWFEMQSNARNPRGFHSNVVTGKAYFMKLFRKRAQQLGDTRRVGPNGPTIWQNLRFLDLGDRIELAVFGNARAVENIDVRA